MSDNSSARELDCIFNVIKWFGLQAILFFLTPYLWNYEYGVGTIVLILIYTTLYAIYGEFTTKGLRLRWSLVPYVVYLIIAFLLYIFTEDFISSYDDCRKTRKEIEEQLKYYLIASDNLDITW